MLRPVSSHADAIPATRTVPRAVAEALNLADGANPELFVRRRLSELGTFAAAVDEQRAKAASVRAHLATALADSGGSGAAP